MPLVTLNLNGCVKLSHQGLACLACFASTVTLLDLTGCFRVGDEGVPALLQFTGAHATPPIRVANVLKGNASCFAVADASLYTVGGMVVGCMLDE